MTQIGKQELIDIMTPVLLEMGYELWGYETQPQGKYQLIRIYIEKEGGVTIEDCAKVSRQLRALFVVEGKFTADHLLEVSSPGMDRILFNLQQCERYVGEKIKVTVLHAIENRKRFVGVLKKIVDDEITLFTEEGDVIIRWSNIAKARLVAL